MDDHEGIPSTPLGRCIALLGSESTENRWLGLFFLGTLLEKTPESSKERSELLFAAAVNIPFLLKSLNGEVSGENLSSSVARSVLLFLSCCSSSEYKQFERNINDNYEDMIRIAQSEFNNKLEEDSSGEEDCTEEWFSILGSFLRLSKSHFSRDEGSIIAALEFVKNVFECEKCENSKKEDCFEYFNLVWSSLTKRSFALNSDIAPLGRECISLLSSTFQKDEDSEHRVAYLKSLCTVTQNLCGLYNELLPSSTLSSIRTGISLQFVKKIEGEAKDLSLMLCNILFEEDLNWFAAEGDEKCVDSGVFIQLFIHSVAIGLRLLLVEADGKFVDHQLSTLELCVGGFDNVVKYLVSLDLSEEVSISYDTVSKLHQPLEDIIDATVYFLENKKDVLCEDSCDDALLTVGGICAKIVSIWISDSGEERFITLSFLTGVFVKLSETSSSYSGFCLHVLESILVTEEARSEFSRADGCNSCIRRLHEAIHANNLTLASFCLGIFLNLLDYNDEEDSCEISWIEVLRVCGQEGAFLCRQSDISMRCHALVLRVAKLLLGNIEDIELRQLLSFINPNEFLILGRKQLSQDDETVRALWMTAAEVFLNMEYHREIGLDEWHTYVEPIQSLMLEFNQKVNI